MIRGSIDDQREAIQGMVDKQRRLGSWLVERMTEVMEDRGMRYQRYDGPVVTDTHIHFERRRVRQRTDGASTSASPSDDQPPV